MMTAASTTVQQALHQGVATLRAAAVASAHLDAMALLEHASGFTRARVVGYGEEMLPAAAAARYAEALERRAAHEPVAKIIGHKEFWGRPFAVSRHVLDPRPDSETLIEAVLKRYPDTQQPLRVLDLGVGSGCLALTILAEYPNATAVGVDISPEALAVAAGNARALQLAKRVEFVHSQWCADVQGVFDLVISNPPYIAESEREALAADVAGFDPALALFAGVDGLDAYRALAVEIPSVLAPGGHVFLEIGAGQAEAVSALLNQQNISLIAVHHDLAGIARILEFNRERPSL